MKLVDWNGARNALNEGIYNALKYGMEWTVKFVIAVASITAGVWVLIREFK